MLHHLPATADARDIRQRDPAFKICTLFQGKTAELARHEMQRIRRQRQRAADPVAAIQLAGQLNADPPVKPGNLPGEPGQFGLVETELACRLARLRGWDAMT